MTISTTQRKIEYAGNGATTVFAFPYRFLLASDLSAVLVLADESTVPLSQGTDYTVTGAGDDEGGDVTLTVAPALGQRLVLFREVELTQETDYISGDPFPAETHERALDKLTMIDQQLQEQIDRTLIMGISVPDGVDNQLPNPQASTLIGWDESGVALRNYNLEDMGVNVAYAQWRTRVFSGDGTNRDFVLEYDAGTASNIDLRINGVPQAPGLHFTYDVDSKTITMVSAPSAGTDNVVARYGQALPQLVSDIADGAVTLEKLADLPAATLIGRNSSSGGQPQAITIGEGLTIDGDGVMSSSGGGSGINLLINPCFRVNQRAYVSGTNVGAANTYTLDRWRVLTSGQNISWTDSGGRRTVTAPAGGVEQIIEGTNLVTGDYVVSWSGTATCKVGGVAYAKGAVIAVTGGANLKVEFDGGTVAEPKFELGVSPTPFQKNPLGQEMLACQRYYYRITPGAAARAFAVGYASSATVAAITFNLPVEMRVAPTALEQSGTAGHYGLFAPSSVTCSLPPSHNTTTTKFAAVVSTEVASGLTAGSAVLMQSVNAAAYLGWSAELTS